MRLAIELYAEKTLFVKEGSFFKQSLRARGLVLEESIGIDTYELGCMMLTGRRLGGSARKKVYDYTLSTAGLGRGEAEPGGYFDLNDDEVPGAAVIIETNLVQTIDLFKELSLRLINHEGKSYEIHLRRPDVDITWNGRGRYVIPISQFIQLKMSKDGS